MSNYVLDSFALLAFFQDEPGRPRVQELLDRATADEDSLSLTVVNLGEVIYGLINKQDARAAARALIRIDQWPLEIVQVDRELALQAAYAKADYKLGYMDAFPFALARRLGGTVVTGDPDFLRVQDVVPIDWLTQPTRKP